jgi:hypothetical protein
MVVCEQFGGGERFVTHKLSLPRRPKLKLVLSLSHSSVRGTCMIHPGLADIDMERSCGMDVGGDHIRKALCVNEAFTLETPREGAGWSTSNLLSTRPRCASRDARCTARSLVVRQATLRSFVQLA